MNRRIISKKAQRSYTRRKPSSDTHGRLTSRDFSVIEDNRHSFRLIHKLATNAGYYAAAEARAFIRGDQLVKVFAKCETLAIAPKLNRTSFLRET